MLVIRDLVKVYPGPVTALKNVELQIPEGMFGLIGPNGAGKTTLMRILAGLLEPTSGTVHLDAVEITRRPELVHRQLGYLPQDFGFYPHLTGEQMLQHLLRLKGVRGAGKSSKRLARELLERVGLGGAANRKVRAYSGGMRQRLGIAQAIAGDPRLMIVDEPTAGLDPEERLRFYRILAELSANRIVLLSTHIVEDVAVLCRRFAVIRGGRIVANTTPEEARASLEGKIVQSIVAPERLESIAAEHCVTEAILVQGQNRVKLYVPDGPPPEGFVATEPSVEDAYMVLMRSRQSEEHSLEAAATGAKP